MNNGMNKPVKNKLLETFSDKYQVNQQDIISILKSTAFRQTGGSQVSDAQMMSLLVVANKYDLNPFTKEIYAFPSKGSIVPIVSIDGWMKMINSHPDFDGIGFEKKKEDGVLISIMCSIHRKSRSIPTIIEELMQECFRNTDPWKKCPERMLRHKSVIQCARYAFSFSGIYDEDEGERILESVEIEQTVNMEEVEIPTNEEAIDALPSYPEDRFKKNYSQWESAVEDGKLTRQDIIDRICTTYTFTEQQFEMLDKLGE